MALRRVFELCKDKTNWILLIVKWSLNSYWTVIDWTLNSYWMVIDWLLNSYQTANLTLNMSNWYWAVELTSDKSNWHWITLDNQSDNKLDAMGDFASGSRSQLASNEMDFIDIDTLGKLNLLSLLILKQEKNWKQWINNVIAYFKVLELNNFITKNISELEDLEKRRK